MATTTEEGKKELMQTLDDAWNAQDVDIFRQRHKPDVIVRLGPGVGHPNVSRLDCADSATLAADAGLAGVGPW